MLRPTVVHQRNRMLRVLGETQEERRINNKSEENEQLFFSLLQQRSQQNTKKIQRQISHFGDVSLLTKVVTQCD